MSWGTELWDQCDNIGAQTLRGVQFLERYNDFLKERCQVEAEYAKGLRTLCRKYQPKKRDEIDYQFSYGASFLGMLNELNDVAGQHELVSENIRDQVVSNIHSTVKEIKEQRKMYLDEARMIQNHLENTIAMLNQAKREYGKAWKESEAATLKFYKADNDMNLSRNEVEKAKIQMNQKARFCDDSKNGYALQLQKSNEIQHLHYSEKLPAVFEKLRMMDENRIVHMQQMILRCVEIDRCILPIIQKCLDGMAVQANLISADKDSRLVVERFRSGYLPPQSIPFEDLSAGLGSSGSLLTNGNGVGHGGEGGAMDSPGHGSNDGIAQDGGSNNGMGSSPGHIQNFHRPSVERLSGGGPVSAVINGASNLPRKSTMRKTKLGKIMSRLGPKSDDFKEDFSDLPPQQRLNKVHERMDLVQNSLNQHTSTRDGLLRMQKVYEENPKYGDPAGVQAELQTNAAAIEKLQIEIRKLEIWEKEASAQLNIPINQVIGGGVVSSPVPAANVAPGQRVAPGSGGSPRKSPSSGSTPRHQSSPQRTSFSSESLSSRSASENSVQHPQPPPANGPASAVPPAPPLLEDGGNGVTNSGAPDPPTAPPPTMPPGGGSSSSTQISPRPPGPPVGNMGEAHFPMTPKLGGIVGKLGGGVTGGLAASSPPPPRPNPPVFPSTGSSGLSASVTAHLRQSGMLRNNVTNPTNTTSCVSASSEKSGVETGRISFADSELDGNSDQLYNEPEPQILGTCRAMYNFDGGSDGTVPVREGEDLLILERDEGDGWTRIRHCTELDREGFVPTSYLECKLYPV